MLKYFVILLAVFIAGVPVAVAMGGTATLLLIMERGFAAFNPAIIAQKSCYGLNNFGPVKNYAQNCLQAPAE